MEQELILPKQEGGEIKIRCEYFEALKEQKLSRCPHIIRKLAGDETYDTCGLNTKSCLIEHGLYDCETWEEIQKEWLKEVKENGKN